MISSSADAYFDGAVMYYLDGTTIVPYWWPCSYCDEKFRSPALRTTHMESAHWQVIHSKGTITNIRYDIRVYGEDEEIVGVKVTWRNDSPFNITGRITATFRHASRGSEWLSATVNQDKTLTPGQSIVVYLTGLLSSIGLDRGTTAYLYLYPVMVLLDTETYG